MTDRQESSKGSDAKWPRIVFVDTNVLYSLGSQFEHVDFAELLELREILGFALAVPTVCWLEYLRQRRVEIDTCLQSLRKSASLFRRLGLKIDQFSESEQLLKAFDLEKHFGEKAKSLGISLLGLPVVDVHKLLKMAVDRTAPFQESGEKGFRDSLILFTCLDTIRKRPELRALAITDDRKLGEALVQFAPEYETEINVVSNLSEAAKHILARMDEHYRERLKREAREARELLLQHREQIEKRVSEITEFSQFEIAGFGSLDIGSVERVLSLKFDDIQSAVWKEKDKNGGRILFRAGWPTLPRFFLRRVGN